MGLGLLGRGIQDAAFFAKEGAEVIVTDLKSEEVLRSSLEQLKEYKNITYVLGEHRLEDFRDRDLILKAAGVPLESKFIDEARRHNIPVEMDASLFAKHAPGVILIGITGTRGKTTTTSLIYDMAKRAFSGSMQNVFLTGNIRGKATLPLLDEAKRGDIVVMELDSWQLQGFGEAKISPHISVFTNFMSDHLNYYKGDLEKYLDDKANIFLHQKQNDYLVTSPEAAHLITAKYFGKLANQPITTSKDDVPKDWKIQLPGEHNKTSIALAISVGKILKIKDTIIKESVENFTAVEGRLQFLKEWNGVKIYNDNNATTPDATLVALKALENLASKPCIILIMGGADKTLDMAKLVEVIPQYCKKVILLPGTGTDKLKTGYLELKAEEAVSLAEAVQMALKGAKTGDIVLFSPAFASFGLFKNEYDRGDQFMALINDLK